MKGFRLFRLFYPWKDDHSFEGITVCYGEGDWPSYSQWIVPGTYMEG